jgi:hypothetical protein
MKTEDAIKLFVTPDYDFETLVKMYQADPWFNSIIHTVMAGGSIYQYIPKLIEFKVELGKYELNDVLNRKS